MVSITATVGASNANSYETLEEYKVYLALRLNLPALVTGLLASDPSEHLAKSLLMGTRALDLVLTKHKRLEVSPGRSGVSKFYIVSPYWNGQPATATQSLSWPRIGMLDRNGNTIASTVIPQELKDAESEFSILALTTDLLADNATITAGLTGLRAGPVELSFKEYIQVRSLPLAIRMMIIPGWITEETYENVPQAQFRTGGLRRC